MYLSRIALDLRHPSVRQALRDCNDMHRNLMQGFPQVQTETSARNRTGVLYRLVEKRDEVYLLVASDVAPDGAALGAKGYRLSPDSPKDVSALEQVFVDGMALRFELVASPCKKQAGEQKNSRRVFLNTAEARAEWLARKAAQNGFEVLEVCEYSNRLTVEGFKGDMHIGYGGVRFVGTLRILDRARFWQAYRTGIGPGKAYGLGMLTVARL